MLKINKFRLCYIGQRFLSAQSNLQPDYEVYTEKPEYPPILDQSYAARKLRKAQYWHEQIKKLNTVEEKQIKLNMRRYWGYKVTALDDTRFRYNSLPMMQHYTRTLFEKMDKLPDTENSSKIDSLVKAISREIQESVEFAIEHYKHNFKSAAELTPQQQENEYCQILIEEVNRSLINCLSSDYPHLLEAEIDSNPRHEASWFVGGVCLPSIVESQRKNLKWMEYKDKPMDRVIYYKGSPYLTLRHKHLLPAILSMEEYTSLEKANSIPIYEFDAKTLGYSSDYKYLANIPGYWPGSQKRFGLVSFEKRDHTLLNLNSSWKPQDFEEALHSQGILSSFVWTFAQANYLGFTTYNDLTYPINTQTIITNGKEWSFYQYQLNTSLVYSEQLKENPKINCCWGTEPIKFYEEVDSNGKLIGFNEEVLKNLVKIYINVPKERDYDLTPYLNENEKFAANIDHQERREFMEDVFKRLASNRPRHLPLPEIYNWEKIYKIDHKTRPMDARRKFFEVEINPWRRRLDQHCPEYIPKCLRPDGPKSKNKFKKLYYP